MKHKTKVDQIIEYLNEDPWDPIPAVKTLMRKFKCSSATVYKALKAVEDAEDMFDLLDQEEADAVYQANSGANSEQVGGSHYVSMGVQPWDAMESWMSYESFAGFLRGNAIKYLARTDKKGGIEDLKKARHYLNKLIELMEAQ